jgi:hypothetical protein
MAGPFTIRIPLDDDTLTCDCYCAVDCNCSCGNSEPSWYSDDEDQSFWDDLPLHPARPLPLDGEDSVPVAIEKVGVMLAKHETSACKNKSFYELLDYLLTDGMILVRHYSKIRDASIAKAMQLLEQEKSACDFCENGSVGHEYSQMVFIRAEEFIAEINMLPGVS